MNWIEWSPEWAKHISGRYTPREVDMDGLPVEQRIVARCNICGTVWQGGCLTGAVRAHIQRFAYVHTHRDPLATK